jgi:hypothetical protein
MQTEDAAEKIAKLEAFLTRHPDWEYGSSLKMVIADAHVELGHYDPELVTRILLEALAMPGGGGCDEAIWRVERYSLKNQFPLPNARLVLKAARQKLFRDRRERAKKGSEVQRIWEEYALKQCEYRVPLVEGEILLERGDATGALPLLRQAETRGFLMGNDLLMVDEKGASRGVLPTGELDTLDLALAKAYAHIGNLPAARNHLARLSLHSWAADYQSDLQAIFKEVGWHQPTGREWTADPVQAGSFEFKDLEGKKVRYDDYRGKVVLLNFWATT